MFDERLDLFVHVELNIIQTAAVLAACTGTFPSAEWLEAWPCAGCRALRTIGIGHASFDLIEEPL